MKKKWLEIALIGLILIINLAFYNFDKLYHSKLMLLNSYNDVQLKSNDLISPNKDRLLFLTSNYWQVSPLFSNLEDTFYPFRKWSTSISATTINYTDYSAYKAQLLSLSKNEKATFVRAKKAYALAKRVNFNKPDLNEDANVKKQQWLSVFRELFNRKVLLENGTYNTIQFILFWMIFIGGMTVFLFKLKIKDMVIINGALFTSLILSSYQPIMSLGVPFHILFFIFIFPILRNNAQPLPRRLSAYLGLIICVSAFLYSYIAFFISVGIFLISIKSNYLQQLMRLLSLLHPIGLAQLNKTKSLFSLVVIVFGLIAINLFVTNTHLLAPMAYAPKLLREFEIIIIGWLGLSMLSLSTLNNQKNRLGWLLGMALIGGNIWLIDQVFLKWCFEFFWYPLFMWAGVLLIIYQGIYKEERSRESK